MQFTLMFSQLSHSSSVFLALSQAHVSLSCPKIEMDGSFFFFFKYSSEDMLIDFRDRGREGERK